MEKVNDIITLIQNIKTEQIIDVIVAISALIIFVILSPNISYFLLRIFFKKIDKKEIRESGLFKTLRVFFHLLGLYISLKILNLNIEHDIFVDKCFRIVIIWTIVNVIAGILELRAENKEYRGELNKKDKFASKLIGAIVKLALYIIAIYLSFKEFNYDLGGLAAGLGIGGAIVALAAQNVVKQILAGFAILSDKPFEIGDWIEVNEVSGTVESITWRSTKLKTVKDTIVTMDNSELIISNIVNWGKIKKRIYQTNLRLSLETEEAVVEKIINRIKFILKYNDKIIKDTVRVNLSEIQEDALNIAIFLETSVINYQEYLTFCNSLNLTFLNILETQGVKLAYPGHNIYIKENILPQTKINEKNEETKKKTSPLKIMDTGRNESVQKK